MTVSGTMTLPVRRKKASISLRASWRVVEGDEEALGAVLAHHDGLEGVDVRAADLVLLLHLDRIPDVHEVELASALAPPFAASATTG